MLMPAIWQGGDGRGWVTSSEWITTHIHELLSHGKKRKRGRPRETWRRTVERELEKEGLRTWAAAASAAEDRTAWRQRAYGPILHLENG